MPHPRMTGAAFDNMMTLASAVILFPVLEHGLKQRCLFSIDTCFDDSMQSGDDADHENTNTQKHKYTKTQIHKYRVILSPIIALYPLIL